MDAIWDIILVVSKITFIALIYLLLLMIIVAVRREMRHHLEHAVKPSTARSRKLKILQVGTDAQLRPGQVLELPDWLTIGANDENHVVFTDRFVSSRHAQLRWDGAKWLITDLNSTNGTFIDGQRCPPHSEQPVPSGATLQLGDVVLQLLE